MKKIKLLPLILCFCLAAAAFSPTAFASPAPDLNEASTDSLQRLPGIGPVLADAIVAWREENGPFEKPEDLMRVPGIGKAKYAAVQDMITVEGTK